jgi:hypothetical protein
MPGIAKRGVQDNSTYIESISRVQAAAEDGLRAKQARAREARANRDADEARQCATTATSRETIAFIERYAVFNKAIRPHWDLKRFKSKACLEFRELYAHKYGKVEGKEARDARKVHFNEQFEEWFVNHYGEYINEVETLATDTFKAIYAKEFPDREEDSEHELETLNNATRAYKILIGLSQAPNFSVEHHLRCFRRMEDGEFSDIIRFGGNASPNMRKAASIAYKERKSVVDANPPNLQFPRALMQPHSESVGPNGETSETHDFVKEAHKTGGKGQVVVAGSWVLRQRSDEAEA